MSRTRRRLPALAAVSALLAATLTATAVMSTGTAASGGRPRGRRRSST